MKKLEDIPKKDLFSAPEGYFEELPNRISVRLEVAQKPERSVVFRYALQFAVPIVALIVIGFSWYRQYQATPEVERMLASVDTADLVLYLDESDFDATEDADEDFDANEDEVRAIEDSVYSQQWKHENLEEIMEELDINTL